MKDILKEKKKMEKENILILMEIYKKVHGSKMKKVGKELTIF